MTIFAGAPGASEREGRLTLSSFSRTYIVAPDFSWTYTEPTGVSTGVN